MDVAPGMILLDKFRVEQVLGIGGMGKVVKAAHIYLQHHVAIKVLLPQMMESDSTRMRFLREAQATSKLRSEHIARVTDACELPDGTPIMVMEYLQGNDLNQILRHHGPQSPNVVVDLMLQACEGIAEAHAAGIVHRDIKPSNFFITLRPDNSMLLKILDFGISKAPIGYESDLTGTQTQIGTPTYMAPEQMKLAKNADTRSDIWSLGVVMYQMMTGRPPFEAESYAALVLRVGLEPPAPMHVNLPAGLGEVILRCLEKDPRNRHPTVGDLAKQLAPFATDPIAAAHIAERTQRTLTARNGAPTMPGGHTRLTQPVPLSPQQLTPGTSVPQSQHGTNGTSNPAGQMTYRTQSSRGIVIAGVALLVIVAGAGGWFAATSMRDSRTDPAVTPTSTKLEDLSVKPSEPVVTKPVEPAVVKPSVEQKPVETKVVETKPTETKPVETKPVETKPVETKPVETKSVETKPAETKPADTETKTAKTPVTGPTAPKQPVTRPAAKQPAGDDLFDSRH